MKPIEDNEIKIIICPREIYGDLYDQYNLIYKYTITDEIFYFDFIVSHHDLNRIDDLTKYKIEEFKEYIIRLLKEKYVPEL